MRALGTLLFAYRGVNECMQASDCAVRAPFFAVQVTLVKAAGRPEQQIWKSTLAQASDEIQQRDLSPCVLVIGNVCGI
jgi:siroheme synthase